MTFAEVEDRYRTLRQRFDAGALSEADFKARLEDLMIEDGQGRWWIIGYETGQWYVREGEQWVPGAPPLDTEHSAKGQVKHTAPRTSRRWTRWLGLAAGLLGLAGVIVAGIVLWPRSSLTIGSALISPQDGMVTVYVPAGEFMMGAAPDSAAKIAPSETPLHRVRLDAFWIDRTEVTNAMFARFLARTNYKPMAVRHYTWNFAAEAWELNAGADWQHPHGSDSNITGLDQHPVVQVAWEDARTYCAWAGRRLPTEAEWEKAARGTDQYKYPWDNGNLASHLLNSVDVNVSEINKANRDLNDGYRFTAPVGSYLDGASPYGILDMAGNVWEWVADFFDDSYYKVSPLSNPPGPSSGFQHGARGGSWISDFGDVRTTARIGTDPFNGAEDLGFRCALDAR